MEMDALVVRFSLPHRAAHGTLEAATMKQAMRTQKGCRAPLSEASNDVEETTDDAESSTRKTTYYKRKREIRQLQDEMERLQARLRMLQQPVLERETELLQQSLMANRVLKRQLQDRSAVVANFESAFVGNRSKTITLSPLSSYIRLSRDPEQRARTLHSLKREKLEDAKRFIKARCEFVDLRRSCKEQCFYEAPNGDRLSRIWQVSPVDEASSVKELFDEVRYFEETEELGISEKLGVITVREADGDHLGSILHTRLLFTFFPNVQVELNHASFSQYFEGSDTSPPYAIIHANHIEEDELYPYQPNARIRQDVSSIILITEVPSSDPNKRPQVVLALWAIVRVHKSSQYRPCDLDHVCQEAISRWCDVMLRCVQERLTWRSTCSDTR